MDYESRDRLHADLTDPGEGIHLWTLMVMFRIHNPEMIKDPTAVIHMDRENLLTIEGPGCFKCEQPWNDRLARMRCKGSMEMMP
jgi:hypothetical protein